MKGNLITRHIGFAALILMFSSATLCLGQEQSDMFDSYDQPWNIPTVCHNNFNDKYVVFGFNNAKLPPIPGLKYRSCSYQLTEEEGFRALLALRCPPIPKLLQHVGQRVFDWSSTGGKAEDLPVFESSEQIRSYFINEIKKEFYALASRKDPLPFGFRSGLLMTDCWKIGKLYTFYESYWIYSSPFSKPALERYFMINSETGEVLQLKDLVAEEHWDKLAAIQKKYLRKRDGTLFTDEDWIDPELAMTHRELLDQVRYCALIREGLVLTYLDCPISPMNNPLKAIIPYAKIRDILLIDTTDGTQ